MVAHECTVRAEEMGTGDGPWGSLFSWLNLLIVLQGRERPCLNKQGDELRNNT